MTGLNMQSITLSIDQARKLTLAQQLLAKHPNAPGNKEGVLQTIEHLGYVQIDTISVVRRAHHQTLWTRVPDYRPDVLHELQSSDRKVFEYWGHAMSYLPMSAYRYHIKRMHNFHHPSSPWAKMQYEKSKDILDSVLKRIRDEGPLSTRDFQSGPKRGQGWWDWKPAKVAMEVLFWRGDLMITGRRNFQKIYDLTERVLPPDIDTTQPPDEEIATYIIKTALRSMGLAMEGDIQRFLQPESSRDADMRLVSKETIRKSIQTLLERGELLQVELKKHGHVYYTLPGVVAQLEALPELSDRVFFISPFDNLIVQRDRIQWLFNFKYALECYMPEAKRICGYFVMPILWGNRFVGRMDPKAVRSTKTLLIRRLMFEADFRVSNQFMSAFTEAVKGFASFNGCDSIAFEQVESDRVRQMLRKYF